MSALTGSNKAVVPLSREPRLLEIVNRVKLLNDAAKQGKQPEGEFADLQRGAVAELSRDSEVKGSRDELSQNGSVKNASWEVAESWMASPRAEEWDAVERQMTKCTHIIMMGYDRIVRFGVMEVCDEKEEFQDRESQNYGVTTPSGEIECHQMSRW